MYAILLYLITYIPLFLCLGNPDLNALGVVGLLANVAFQAWAVFMLAEALQVSVPVLWAATMLIPFVSLLLLVLLNSKATSALKAAGIPVGLMGADPDKIRADAGR